MQNRVARINARLSGPPEGFRFDSSHLPHVTLVQQFVPAADLPLVTAEVGAVLSSFAPLTLTTERLSSNGLTTSLVLAATQTLGAVHTRLMDRLAPFDMTAGGADAFVTDGEPPRTRERRVGDAVPNRRGVPLLQAARHPGSRRARRTGAGAPVRGGRGSALPPRTLLHLPACAGLVDARRGRGVILAIGLLAAVGLAIASYFTAVALHWMKPDARWVPAFCRLEERTCASVVFTPSARVFGPPQLAARPTLLPALLAGAVSDWLTDPRLWTLYLGAAS